MANVVYVTGRRLESSRCGGGYYHIAEVKWVNRSTGESGTVDRQGMVEWLAQVGNEAYSQAQNGQTAPIHVLKCGNHLYIETNADNSKADNLRELPSY